MNKSNNCAPNNKNLVRQIKHFLLTPPYSDVVVNFVLRFD